MRFSLPRLRMPQLSLPRLRLTAAIAGDVYFRLAIRCAERLGDGLAPER
ncbi:Uncharacterised protein [Klebsiella pneumoniae]|nr:Uncharacterised protein [Klebsiella pneumoniae]